MLKEFPFYYEVRYKRKQKGSYTKLRVCEMRFYDLEEAVEFAKDLNKEIKKFLGSPFEEKVVSVEGIFKVEKIQIETRIVLEL